MKFNNLLLFFKSPTPLLYRPAMPTVLRSIFCCEQLLLTKGDFLLCVIEQVIDNSMTPRYSWVFSSVIEDDFSRKLVQCRGVPLFSGANWSVESFNHIDLFLFPNVSIRIVIIRENRFGHLSPISYPSARTFAHWWKENQGGMKANREETAK